MTSEILCKNIQGNDFLSEAFYFGISLNTSIPRKQVYTDLESFVLKATYSLSSSRITEGILCWLKAYGHLLSPSKVRRLILAGEKYDPAVFGAFTDFLINECKNGHQFKILPPFSSKLKLETSLYSGPRIRRPNTYFKKYNLIVHSYKLNHNKFLLPRKHTYKTCIELKNRALFGSTVNADISSYLSYNPSATAYKVSKKTFHHKASVFKVFADIQESA